MPNVKQAHECEIALALYPCTNIAAYAQYEGNLFDIFRNLYYSDTLMFNGKPVKMKRYPPDYGIRTGFYHLICENYNHTGREEDREPKLPRCERLRWPAYIIDKCSDGCCDHMMIWENERHGAKNILFYCEAERYLVVLSIRNDYYLLTSAYYVDQDHTRRKLYDEYRKYKQTTPTI